MKKVQKGFTLVELIVVITILAVLGTIAFVSLQGYSQDAKNSKVTSDVRTLTTAIETAMTNGTVTQINTLPSGSYTSNQLATSVTVGSGTALSTVTASGGAYAVGEVNFQTLRQNGDDFTYDAAGTTKKYLIGAVRMVGNSTFKQGLQMYQVAGAVSTNGTYKPVVKGNYVEYITSDADGLIKDTDGAAAGLVNDSAASMSGTVLY